ncbi:MerR family transcriptional regulator [Sphingobium xenophagum]|uniref:MerR family transcriptional regulator n=1 Tax=Sphingobium xenophagum TaxID=121428 RepID=UPI00035FC064|nr:MerR family transcriptional regulator [Sphingobium xenophagum]
MTDYLDIAAVVRQAGVTSRALRYYEARGLLHPLRTGSGRRLFGPMQLTRLHQLLTLKRAGFTLAQIGKMFAEPMPDIGALLRAQMQTLDDQVRLLDHARYHLDLALSRIARSEPLDTAILCSLIRHGGKDMDEKDWKKVTDLYFSAQAEADFADAQQSLPTDFDQAAYGAQWAALTQRIAGALPLDPASEQAQTFYDEWQALLAPFMAAATPAMQQGVVHLYDHIGEWEDNQTPPFPSDIWDFIRAAGVARTQGRAGL